jgi:hypothetical protein
VEPLLQVVENKYIHLPQLELGHLYEYELMGNYIAKQAVETGPMV